MNNYIIIHVASDHSYDSVNRPWKQRNYTLLSSIGGSYKVINIEIYPITNKTLTFLHITAGKIMKFIYPKPLQK